MKFITREYEETMGVYSLPEGLREKLSGLSIEKQAEFFCAGNGYRDIPLESATDIKELIIKDGVIVGAMVSDWANYPTPCFLGQTICTWDTEDNNGAGYKTRTEHLTLKLAEKQ